MSVIFPSPLVHGLIRGVSESFEYRIGLPEQYRLRAAELYEGAFRQKFLPVIKSTEKTVEILVDSIIPEYAVAAIENERLIGIAGFHGRGGYFTGGGSSNGIIRRLGLMRGLWTILILGIIYERKPAPGELLMDGIAVDESYRGRGIGTGIMNRLFKYGLDEGYGTVRLDVIDINDRARRLYEKVGFKAVKTDYHPYLKEFIGFSSSTIMVKELT